MNNESSDNPDGRPAGRLETSSTGPQTSSSRTPLRQLLHWATGDRDAEAQALADETLALRNAAEQQRNPDEQQGVQEGEQQAEAVLAAAKSAVSLAHGDSLVPAEASRAIHVKESDDGTNLLAQWEDAISFTETPPADTETPPADTDPADTDISAIGPDVARPADVEVIVDVESGP